MDWLAKAIGQNRSSNEDLESVVHLWRVREIERRGGLVARRQDTRWRDKRTGGCK